MSDICSVCGLPKELCVCKSTTDKEENGIVIKTDTKKFRKQVTIITGNFDKAELKQLAKELKRKLACGGTVSGNSIELQGEHVNAVKEFFIKKGYPEESILIVK
jgi:translation initiation factor 1